MKKKNKAAQPRSRLPEQLKRLNWRALVFFSITGLLVFCLLAAVLTPKRYHLSVGQISRDTITASKDVVDTVTTEARRESAAAAVEPSYRMDESVAAKVLTDLDALFAELQTVQQYGMTLRTEADSDASFARREFTKTELDYAQKLIKSLILTDYQVGVLLRATNTQFADMVQSVRIAVENTLNTTIREQQESQSIQTILQIVGYKVDTSLFQSIVPTVLRSCIRPNMTIEVEATEAARDQAREEVEPVLYLQGQNIIREGERVSTNQLEMLRSLGLLDDYQLDLTMYGGAVLMAISLMLFLWLMIRLLQPALLHDIARLCVLMVVLMIGFAASLLTSLTINDFVAPVAVAAMLAVGLIGGEAGVIAAFATSMLVGAGLISGSQSQTVDIVLQMLASVCGGLTATVYLRRYPQRVHMLLAGLLEGLIHVLLLVTLSLMTVVESSYIRDHALWCLGSGLLSGLIAMGIQPVIESAFNLATPSKLLELCNPNNPLLRRLLVEASGTYHHSIIVANLAEAAAEKINANALLARTGAYYHDIGKLQRPLYFKENQMGENPHDKTDPYVSAAIVTAHTKDGLKLAQKQHLPREVQKMVVEHHGDTPVMYFYHKACQLANGTPVDIANFRYSGPRPTMKESAILMLADTVEAAVRSMHDPTPQGIEELIERLVRGKVEDGQLSNAPLTLRDIDGICEAFAQVVNGAFHERIEYPHVDIPKRPLAEIVAQPTGEEADKPAEAPAEKAAEAEPAGRLADVSADPADFAASGIEPSMGKRGYDAGEEKP